MYQLIIISLIAAVVFLFSCNKDKEENKNEPVVIIATGSIDDEVNAFRELLGTERREVNWDGVPNELVGMELPSDFFNPTGAGAPPARQRGLAYSAASGQFSVSNTGFADLNSSAAAQFKPFSGDKVFANVSSNLWEVSFQVPGQNINARVKGFGAVFSDVDLQVSTFLDFFNGSKNLGRFHVQPHNNESSFSFVGVYFGAGETITRVVVHHNGTLGDGPDVTDSGTTDQIVLDDFIYGEPVAE